jgi:hypothetical protein
MMTELEETQHPAKDMQPIAPHCSACGSDLTPYESGAPTASGAPLCDPCWSLETFGSEATR